MSDFPSEGNATYQYDGAGKRRPRTGGDDHKVPVGCGLDGAE